MPDVQGRVLEEALKGGPPVTDYTVLSKTDRSSKKTGLKVKLPSDLDGQAIDPDLSDILGRAEDENSYQRRYELHLFRSGESGPRINRR